MNEKNWSSWQRVLDAPLSGLIYWIQREIGGNEDLHLSLHCASDGWWKVGISDIRRNRHYQAMDKNVLFALRRMLERWKTDEVHYASRHSP